MNSDIVGRYIPKHTDLLFELRDRAQADDLRNREIAPDVEPFDTTGLDSVNVYEELAELRSKTASREESGIVYCIKSGCFNIITIADRWGVCSDCRRKGF